MAGYKDHSPSVIDNEDNAKMAQMHLNTLGFDLQVDGDWGPASREAAAAWQQINGYEDITGEITSRQIEVLEMQAAHPEIYTRMRLAETFNNFDMEVFSDISPARQALVKQGIAHVGALEVGGDNKGPNVDQYFSEIPGVDSGAWCISMYAWADEQLERQAGLGAEEEHSPNIAGVHSFLNHLRENNPEAIKSMQDYEPEGGDVLMLTRPDGTGHAMMVAGAINYGNGITEVAIIHGNTATETPDVGGVLPGTVLIYTDEASGRSFMIEQDLETGMPMTDPNDGSFIVNFENDVYVADWDEMPHSRTIENHFNTNADTLPVPPADPDFKANVEALQTFESYMKAMNDQRAQMNVPVPAPETIYDQGAPALGRPFTSQ